MRSSRSSSPCRSSRTLPKDRILVDVAAKLSNTALKDALPGIDITKGEIDLTVEKGVFKAKGPANIAGIPSKLVWERGPAPDFKQSAVIETTLDGEQRQKLGIDLGTFARGPVGVTATIPDLGDPQGRMEIEADLSEVELRVPAHQLVPPGDAQDQATLTYYSKGEKGPRVEDLVIKGKGLSVKGDLTLAPKRQGLRSARLSEVRLSDENRLRRRHRRSARTAPASTSTATASMRARSSARMFGVRNKGDAGDQTATPKPPPSAEKPVRVTLKLAKLHANRGEIIKDVNGSLTARGSRLEQAEIEGTFLSGQPVVFRVTPVEGGREMRINGRDGGAAIRAANLYSKVAGGQIEFYALLASDGSSVQEGPARPRAISRCATKQPSLNSMPAASPSATAPGATRSPSSKLTLPFTSDGRFIRIGESLVRGPELGASAEGLIRKSDGAIDITGTIIPAYALNSALGDIPLFGDILTGGKGQGIIGVTFALGGTVDKPVFQMNPVSAVAPGIFRKFFEYGNSNSGNAPKNRPPKDNSP